MTDRLGPPFRDSEAMADAYNHACYLREFMGLTFDESNGDITCRREPYGDGSTIAASPGEVLETPSVYGSLLVNATEAGLSDIARLINVGYMLGVLSREVEV